MRLSTLRKATVLTGLLVLSILCFFAYAGDLDDGISTYTDDSIESYNSTGKPDPNINFIVVKAMAEAKMGVTNGDGIVNFNDGSGDNNENSVVVGPGTNMGGDIYNINVQP